MHLERCIENQAFAFIWPKAKYILIVQFGLKFTELYIQIQILLLLFVLFLIHSERLKDLTNK